MFLRFHYILLLIILSVLTTTASGQNLVSTSPQNKNAVVEEFGGIYCVYCPEGHQILNQLEGDLEENLILLNYHTSSYAVPLGMDPDLRSGYGVDLLSQTSAIGFPVATVNRRNFPGYEQGDIPGSTAIGRLDWASAIATTLQEASPVNIGAEATLNIATRELVLTLEYYYTADVDAASNALNIAVLQNNVLAPQHGGGQGEHYVHQHLVRDFLTGQWGHTIATTTMGTFGSLTYEYTLPLDYRDVWVDLFNIELAIFIGENEQNIYTGVSVKPELISSFSNDADLVAIYAENDLCDHYLMPDILIRNDGNQVLNSMDIVYSIDGFSIESYNWHGDLQPLEEVLVELPSIAVPESTGSYILDIELQSPNGEADPTAYNNNRSHHFSVAPVVDNYHLELAIKTDEFGHELYWEIVDELGSIYAFGGNLVVGETEGGAQIASSDDPGVYPSSAFIVEDIELPFDGCYRLKVLDDFADGLCCEYGIGFYKLRQAGEPAFIEGSSFSTIDEHLFFLSTIATEVQEEEKLSLKIFPNPAKIGQEINLSLPNNTLFEWQLSSLNGQLLLTGNEQNVIETKHLSAGYYLLHLQSEEGVKTFPLIIHP